MDVKPTGMTSDIPGFASAERLPSSWLEILPPALEELRRIAGTTENEFLKIGSQLQDFYLRSSDITAMANRLVELVSGDQLQQLIGRFQQMISDMEAYLANARTQSEESCAILDKILTLLEEVFQPLEGFQKMNKVLRMLSISTKIESARLGDKGADFITLAMDVEKLSHIVYEKSATIFVRCQTLAGMIRQHLQAIRKSEAVQDAEIHLILNKTSGSSRDLVALNSRCSRSGEIILSISGEVSGNISNVVSSMQFHDITRQQIEHVVEALERLTADLRVAGSRSGSLDDELIGRKIMEAGDVCELQVAQLQHVSGELHGAVAAIIENLRDVGRKQSLMNEEMLSATGVADSTGRSFFEEMSSGMATVTTALSRCAEADHEMSETMRKVSETIGEISSFVTDIEEIGSEIDLIALNSQVKAAHTGKEGAALGVLAEAIKRLSVDAVVQTDAVSKSLVGINAVTENICNGSGEDSGLLSGSISCLEEEFDATLTSLASVNKDLLAVLSELNGKVCQLTMDIEDSTSAITVHEKSSQLAGEVSADLGRIVASARLLAPASNNFKENLRHLEESYTMQSERRIHESIVGKRANGAGSRAAEPEGGVSASESDSEFGDNVELF